MSSTDTAAGPAAKWRTTRWVVLALIAVAAVAAVGTYLTAPRPGKPMDPQSTSPDGARALVTLLRDRGIDVIEADTLAEAQAAARPDTLLVVAQSQFLDSEQVNRLAELPGDRLLVEPVSRTREGLAPALKTAGVEAFAASPGCDLREATQAGQVLLGVAATYEAGVGDVAVTRCYDGALTRYTDAGRTITVVGAGGFLTNGQLLKQGNAALAMNLVGSRPRVVWYAPQQREVESAGDATISDLLPKQVSWVVLQLALVVLLVAFWRGRRLGALVAEQLPVVVRASETVEGRGRLYRSHRAQDRAADALRTAALQRLVPRLGLPPNAAAPAVVAAIAARAGADPDTVGRALFGPAPTTDGDLVDLARQLDDIERQVAHS
jgi:hypothetical protein